MKELFGGSETESQQQSTSTPKDMTPEELKALRGPFVQALTSLFSQQGRPAYTGPLVAPIEQRQLDAIDRVTAQANDPTRRGLLEQTMQGNFLPGQPGSNPFLEEAIRSAQRPTLQGLEETLGRTLPGRFTQAGHLVNAANMPNQAGGSSAFDRAAAIATRGTADALGSIATNMAFQGYEAERGRQQQAIQLSQQEIAGLAESLKDESLPQMIKDLGVDRGIKEFQSRMTSLVQALSIASGAPISQIAQESQSTGSSQGEQFGGIIPAITPFITGGPKKTA